jgi:zinc protease
MLSRHRSMVPVGLRTMLAVMLMAMSLLARSGAALALNVEEIVSQKGIKAWLVEEHAVPLIAIKFAFMGGAAQDLADKEGLVGMVADLLTEGAGDLPAVAFKQKLSELGAHLTARSGRDAIYGGLETLSKRLVPSAELLRLMLVSPRFDADAIETVRAQRLTDLALAANEPTRLALDRWYAEAFPGHPYGRPMDGTPDTVARIAAADIKAKHAQLFARDVLRVVIVGDIDKSAAIGALDSIFGGLPEKAKTTPVARIDPRPLPAPVVIDKDYPLATATFGLPSLRTDDPEFPALQVLNHILGSGDFDSKLMEEVRVKRGLAYSIQTNLLGDTVTALMVGGVATKNEAMGKALNVIKTVFADMARNGPGQAEFENAKRYLTGSFMLDFDTNAKVANSLLGIQLDGEGPGYLLSRNQKINAVQLADVRRVAEQVLKPDRLVVTIVGKPNMTP